MKIYDMLCLFSVLEFLDLHHLFEQLANEEEEISLLLHCDSTCCRCILQFVSSIGLFVHRRCAISDLSIASMNATTVGKLLTVQLLSKDLSCIVDGPKVWKKLTHCPRNLKWNLESKKHICMKISSGKLAHVFGLVLNRFFLNICMCLFILLLAFSSDKNFRILQLLTIAELFKFCLLWRIKLCYFQRW
jgi:hypothetical protein